VLIGERARREDDGAMVKEIIENVMKGYAAFVHPCVPRAEVQ
jgi:hypothetical protein